MSIERVAKRYASAFFDFAREKGSVTAVLHDVELIATTCSSSEELHSALVNPVINPAIKISVVNEIFGAKVSESTQAMLNLLGTKNRLPFLSEICKEIIALNKDANNIVEVTLVSARPMEETQVEKLAEGLGTNWGKTVIFTREIDPTLVGGFKLITGDRIFDCSVQHQLTALGSHLMAEVAS